MRYNFFTENVAELFCLLPVMIIKVLSCCLFSSCFVFQFNSVTQPCLTLCNPMNPSTPGLPVHHQLQEFTQTPVHWVGDAIQPSHPLSSPSPAFNLSQYQGLFKGSALRIRWPKYWSFSFNISPSNEHPGLMSFRTDWLDLLAVQGTLKESSPTPQFKSINSSALSVLHSPTHIHTWPQKKP